MARQRLSVQGMHCSSCGMLIDDALEELRGVRSASTSVRKSRTDVDYDPALTTLEVIASTVTGLGYTVTPF
jgi:copper chaperone